MELKIRYNPQEISDFLTSKGIRASQQRISIMSYLQGVNTHPSVDMVYEALSPLMTTLSKATVYNTLNLFAEKGAVRLVTIDPVERRFDADLSLHGHFRCQFCGNLEDIDLSLNQTEFYDSLGGHFNKSTNTVDIYINGSCSGCNEHNKHN